VLQPFPCVIGIISISISNEQRTVGVIVGVGVDVGFTDTEGVILGVTVGVTEIVGFGVRVTVGVGVFVGETVDVIVGDGVAVAVIVTVGDGVGDTNVSQSIIISLDNVLLVHGESNLIVTFLAPTVSYDLNAL
jgi:hypothetical protein